MFANDTKWMFLAVCGCYKKDSKNFTDFFFCVLNQMIGEQFRLRRVHFFWMG